MRLTVGPLPPAVYWRRRAVVLGAILLFVLVLTYSCAGSGRQPTDPTGAGQSPRGVASSATVLTPYTDGPLASGSPHVPAPTATDTAGQPATGTGQPASGQPVAGTAGDCTDTEIDLAAVPAQARIAPGTPVDLTLRVKNVSSRTCSRDLGSLQQELYLKVGAQKIWSSDTCSNGRDSDVKSLVPNIVHEYRISWNGRDSTRCSGGVASGPVPPAGSYQLFARLGTKLSEPAPLAIGGS
jgi:hypothetical protein